ncbi:MAG: methyltransferase family protein [Rhizobiaceae bacterium]
MQEALSKATDRQDLSRYQHRRRGWLFLAIVLICLGLLTIRPSWDNEEIYETIEAVGLYLIAAGILGRLWATLNIGGKKSEAIVTSGPYSIMRNPLYFFSSIAAIGVGAQTGTLTFAVLAGLLSVIAFHFVIKREEAFLSGVFGEPYQLYCAQVPRFFPNPFLFRDDDTLAVSPKRVYSTFFDGLLFFLALPFFEFVEYLQDSGIVPVLLRLY